MKRIYFYKLIAIIFLATSCDKFLAERNTSYVTNVNSLQDLQAMLDAVNVMNSGSYCGIAEMATDDFFLGQGGLDRSSDLHKSLYLWDQTYLFTSAADENASWLNPFRVISVANNVIDELEIIEKERGHIGKNILGSALFFRAFAYHNLVQVYCQAYDEETAKDDLGLPLKFTSDLSTTTIRATLEDTFQTIIYDLEQALDLLPVNSEYKTRPSKIAAHALLSRVFLLMRRYPEALDHANKSLNFYNKLIDFNLIDPSNPNPIDPLNNETIFFAYAGGATILNPSRECYIDTLLYRSYEDNDLRKKVLFQDEGDGFHTFKGNYIGQPGPGVFIGLTVSELLLIQAEGFARNLEPGKSLEAINMLLRNRYDKDTFVPILINNTDSLLTFVLEQRRKELIFRGTRWSDLKRLNKDPRYAKTLIRKLPSAEESYQLPPNDLRYSILIPQVVIELSLIEQNPR